MEIKLDKAICLCLDKRQEHWEDLREQCESRGIEFIRFLVGKGRFSPKKNTTILMTQIPTPCIFAMVHLKQKRTTITLSCHIKAC